MKLMCDGLHATIIALGTNALVCVGVIGFVVLVFRLSK